MKLSEIPEGDGDVGTTAPQTRTKLSDVGTTAPQEEQPSALGALFRGFLKGFSVAGSPPAILPGAAANMQKVEGAIDQGAQQATAAHPIYAGAGRVAGNIAATAPLAALPGAAATIPGRMGMGAISGALGAAMQPVEGGDYWKEKAKQVALGAGVGGALGGVGRIIGPPLTAQAQSVIDKFPHVASIVRGTAIRSPDNFNRAVVSQALDPIGAVAPKNMKAGHGLMDWASDRLDDAYNKVLPKISMMADPQFTQEIDALKTAAKDLPPGLDTKFVDLVERHIEKPVADNKGVLDGPTFKRVEAGLTKLARNTYAKEPSMKDALYAARESMMDAAARQNPDAANELRNVNYSYAMYARLRDAATRRADSEGVFTPQDLLMASRAGDKTAGKEAYMKGGALMQAVAEATKGPMSGPKVNGLLGAILGGAAGAHVGGLVGGGVGALVGREAVPALAGAAGRATQTPIARGLGRGVSGLAPGAGAAATGYTPKASDRMKAQRKVSEIQRDLYTAKRRGDLAEAQKLQGQLADADAEYRKLRAPA